MRGAQEVLGIDLGAARVEDRGLHGPTEELVGMTAEELVQRVLAGDVDGQSAAAPTRPAPHLPQAGHGAGKGDAHRGVELADVDAQLERVGGHDAQKFARRQAALDLVALRRGVAGAVGRDPLAQLGGEAVDRVLEDELHPLARLHEADRPGAALHQLGEDLGGFVERGRPDPELLVEQRRVPHGHPALGPGGPVVLDQVEGLEARQGLGQIDGVGDRRRRQQEPRLGAVDGGGPAQPAQHVADMGAEDAAVHVRLIDHDEGQIGKEVPPRGVVRQDPDVQHVRVGDDEVAALADRRALVARGVAVIDRGADLLAQAEPVQRPRLVLGQCLGRVQVERAGGAVGGEHLEGGELKAQRLARRGARGDHGRAVEGLEQRLGLVCVEVLDPGVVKSLGDGPAELVGIETRRPGRPS